MSSYDGASQRSELSAVLASTKIVAVLRAPHASSYAPVIEALVEGGIGSIELTLSTAGVWDELPRLRVNFGDDVEIGVGTVTNEDEAQTAIELGAQYVVTPVCVAPVIERCVRAGVPVFPGGLTPTELHLGWTLGAAAVKLFPAATVGPNYIAQLRGPFPDIQVIPSGGIGVDDAAAWIRAGAAAVSLGGPLLQDAFVGGSLDDLRRRAREFRRVVAGL